MILFVGIAYLLRIFDSKNKFDSLKWFQSVSENYEQKMHLIKAQEMEALKEDAKLQQPLSLSYSRLQVYHKVKYCLFILLVLSIIIFINFRSLCY